MIGKNIRFIKFEAKTSIDLEKIINEQAMGLTPISIYFGNNRHYAWFSTPLGSKKKVVRQKTTLSEHTKEKVKLTGDK